MRRSPLVAQGASRLGVLGGNPKGLGLDYKRCGVVMQESKLIDVQVHEARALAALQIDVNRRYAGRCKDLKTWSALKDELVTRAAEIGFVLEVGLETTPDGNWVPVCDIVGRTDKRLERILAEEGPDLERKAWDSARSSSSELEAEGIDTSLLG